MVEKIIKFENGEMNQEETIDFFQEIINSGLVWELQGFYGRQAMELIEENLCTEPSQEQE